ncbi:MAG TPA: STAS domain-containing protein [Solirubrobacteraceae bacterium]|nr:STAS domain-containing protein [Solirubrobacteraceae bacterium]
MSVGEHLRIEVRRDRDRTVLALHGELDLLAAPQLQREIERCEGNPADTLVLDLDDVRFIDSAGLRVILAAHQRAGERGGRMALTPGPEQVQRLLSIAGVGDRLQTIASPDALLV